MRRIELSEGPIWLLIERDAQDLIQVRRLQPSAGQFIRRLFQLEPIESALAISSAGSTAEKWDEVLAAQLAAGRFVDFDLVEDLEAGPGTTQDDVLGGYSAE